MQRNVIISGDGSHTIELSESGTTYHSRRGAINESKHVFIEAGLRYLINRPDHTTSIQIFEMGFGTGLNALLTAIEALEKNIHIHYTAVEPSPLFLEEVAKLNYAESLGHSLQFQQLHEANWNDIVKINDHFTLQKLRTDLKSYTAEKQYHVIYYDAFAPSAQPELWTKVVFEKLHAMLQPGGILVTYCAKGEVQRAMFAAGFSVKKLPGPPGKREMIRAEKPS